MSLELPAINPEQKVTLDDNARKFVTASINAALLSEHKAKSYILITDWLEANEDNEKKLAYKKFANGDVQILLIEKVTKDGSRTAKKNKITETEYAELLGSSILRLEKTRHEFTYVQNDVTFDIKYDEFADSELRVLEVDAASEAERDSFSAANFPGELTEVTGSMTYYGYRVAAAV